MTDVLSSGHRYSRSFFLAATCFSSLALSGQFCGLREGAAPGQPKGRSPHTRLALGGWDADCISPPSWGRCSRWLRLPWRVICLCSAFLSLCLRRVQGHKETIARLSAKTNCVLTVSQVLPVCISAIKYSASSTRGILVCPLR